MRVSEKLFEVLIPFCLYGISRFDFIKGSVVPGTYSPVADIDSESMMELRKSYNNRDNKSSAKNPVTMKIRPSMFTKYTVEDVRILIDGLAKQEKSGLIFPPASNCED